MKRGEDDQARDGEAEELSGLFCICRRDGWRSSDYCSFGIPFFPDDIEGALQKLKLPQREIPFFTSSPNADSVGVTTCSWALRRRRLSDRSGHLVLGLFSRNLVSLGFGLHEVHSCGYPSPTGLICHCCSKDSITTASLSTGNSGIMNVRFHQPQGTAQ